MSLFQNKNLLFRHCQVLEEDQLSMQNQRYFNVAKSDQYFAIPPTCHSVHVVHSQWRTNDTHLLGFVSLAYFFKEIYDRKQLFENDKNTAL